MSVNNLRSVETLHWPTVWRFIQVSIHWAFPCHTHLPHLNMTSSVEKSSSSCSGMRGTHWQWTKHGQWLHSVVLALHAWLQMGIDHIGHKPYWPQTITISATHSATHSVRNVVVHMRPRWVYMISRCILVVYNNTSHEMWTVWTEVLVTNVH